MYKLLPAVGRREWHMVLTALLALGLCSCSMLPSSDPLQVSVAGDRKSTRLNSSH